AALLWFETAVAPLIALPSAKSKCPIALSSDRAGARGHTRQLNAEHSDGQAGTRDWIRPATIEGVAHRLSRQTQNCGQTLRAYGYSRHKTVCRKASSGRLRKCFEEANG